LATFRSRSLQPVGEPGTSATAPAANPPAAAAAKTAAKMKTGKLVE
jgi:hypothetical protein